MVSLKTIAEHCGVSTATVSKALHGQKDVSEKTRKRIREAADMLGYYPNAAARSLKTRRFYNIGVLFSEAIGIGLTHEFFSGVLNGLKVEAEKQGYDITFINTSEENRKMTYYEHCRYRNFEGVAVVNANYSDPRVQEVMNGKIPVVTIDYEHPACASVNSDNAQGMEDLVRYAYEKGHRKIAYIHGQWESEVTPTRVKAYRDTLSALGIKVREEYIREAEYVSIDKVEAHTADLLDLEDAPTCIIYPDDTSYLGGRNVIMERGLRIPEDISVMGYDGTKVSQLLSPSLTTIRQDAATMGAKAAESLIRMIEHRDEGDPMERITVEGMLLKGQSVGKPAGQ